MKSRTKYLFEIKNGEINQLKVDKVKKTLFSKKQYFVFENSDKRIKTDELEKSLFFTLKGALLHV